MKIYLVGGAVRDQLMNYPHCERDWVVVGATPQQMLELGYTTVGKDFPVFLHPNTKEEYALARTERKSGRGYTGFDVDCSAEVTLEEDLARRDLTINAIAQNDGGDIVDPYNGQKDLTEKILRHVSPAFVEDPVRILRVARFAARYHHLGFKVAPETIALMQSMVENGEVDFLVAERIWKETERALSEKNPEIFFQVLRDCGALKKIFSEVDALFGIPQSEIYHPEIDTGIHALMSLQQASILSSNPSVRFAALVHDLGKATTPENELPKHIAHEGRSLPLVRILCKRICAPKEFEELAQLAAEWHTHIHRALELRADTILKVLKSTDAFRRPERFENMLLACEADARGRKNFEEREYPQANYFRNAFRVCSTITGKQIDTQKFSGEKIGLEIDRLRLNEIQQLKSAKQQS